MKIYTKTGDDGTTGLFAGGRVSKDHIRISTYGTVDELNSVLGIARAHNSDKELDAMLGDIQNELFVVGSDLATPNDAGFDMRVRAEDVRRVEARIDKIEQELTPLRNFILPGGTVTASYLHLARTVCRRAERLTVQLQKAETITGEIPVYLNRLSDLLFVLARAANHRAGCAEIVWKKP